MKINKVLVLIVLFLFPSYIYADIFSEDKVKNLSEKGRYLAMVKYTDQFLKEEMAGSNFYPIKKWQAFAYRRIGNSDKAIKVYQELLESARVNKQKEDILDTLRNIGLVCMDKLDYVGALDYFQEAFEIRKDISPSDSLPASAEFNNLGLVLVLSGKDKPRGKFLLEQALLIRKKFLGLHHYKTKITMKNLACAYLYMGRNDRTELYLLKSGSTV